MTTPPTTTIPKLSNGSRTVLAYEIEHCPLATLRLVLNILCDQDEDVAKALHRALCIDKRPSPLPTAVTVIDLTEDPDSDKENALNISKKRKAPEDSLIPTKKIKSVGTIAGTSASWRDRYVHCANCYELFDVVENEQEKNEHRLHPARSAPNPASEGRDEEDDEDQYDETNSP